MAAPNTIIEIALIDGSKVTATLNFARLKKLSSKKRELYKRYQTLTSNTQYTEMEVAELVYVAYVCANIDEEVMDIDEFLELLTPNREELYDIYLNKLQPRVSPKN